MESKVQEPIELTDEEKKLVAEAEARAIIRRRYLDEAETAIRLWADDREPQRKSHQLTVGRRGEQDKSLTPAEIKLAEDVRRWRIAIVDAALDRRTLACGSGWWRSMLVDLLQHVHRGISLELFRGNPRFGGHLLTTAELFAIHESVADMLEERSKTRPSNLTAEAGHHPSVPMEGRAA